MYKVLKGFINIWWMSGCCMIIPVKNRY